MGQFYETIPKSLFEWILAQKMFWVATAPLAAAGHVNLSPKGGAYFGVPDERTFWYMDLTGSGSETVAHLYEPGNGRITVLFSALDGPPRILRLFGRGRALEAGTPAFAAFARRHGVRAIPGARAVVVVDVHQAGTSCGFSVPRYEFREHRTTLNDFFARKDARHRGGDEGESMPRYWALKNAWSMDGLPALRVAQRTMVEEKIEPLKKMVGPLAPSRYQNGHRFGPEHLVLVALVTAVVTAVVMRYGMDAARLAAVRLPADASRWVHAPLRTGI